MASFRARARTVDLLGRQQIAGIPTAISELFKNAHDAYADRVEADFLRQDGVFCLRDDGVGMTGEQFADRWLVLGTESKVRGQATRPKPRIGYLPRPVLGEKGIGRLAIASLGPALLVLTRPLADGTGETPIFGSFLHWGMFEIPRINLDQIEIPIEDLGTEVPDAGLIRLMVDAFASNLEELASDVDGALLKRIQGDLDAFDVDPSMLDRQLPGPSLRRDGHGTHFFVKQADPSLAAVLERRGDRASDLQATLIGFADTMRPGTNPPAIRTAFRDHRGAQTIDLLEPGDFFTPDEFASADHRIEGRFDESGTFTGTVTVYGNAADAYTLAWPRDGNLDCGPFEIHLAAVQPEEASSNLTATALKTMRTKMARLGGLYVYRDGIRILPYGRPENDWLEIEQERTKRLSAYWSHRRMFGEVTLDSERNGALEEKAGREGFRDNRAYRQFRDLLMYFLRNVAADYFEKGGAHAEAFTAAKEELERKARARAHREKQAASLRQAFGQRLHAVASLVEAGKPQSDVDRVLADLDASLDGTTEVSVILEAERHAHTALSEVSDAYNVRRPRGFGLDADLRAAWGSQIATAERIEEELVTPAGAAIGRRVQLALEQVDGPAPVKQRLVSLIADASDKLTEGLAAEAADARNALDKTTADVQALLVDVRRQFSAAVDRVLAQISGLDEVDIESDVEFRRRNAEQELARAAEREGEAVTGVTAQLRAVHALRNGSGLQLSELEAMDAIEEEVITLRERNAAELELAQLGLGIQIVSHEFNASVAAVRNALQQLKPWSDANAGLRRPYQELREGFEHLEGYLRLLGPLQRRLNRRRSRIQGAEIADYIGRLFATRLENGEVELRVGASFNALGVVAFRSTVYPVFVALVDNALYWVGERTGGRWVSLDAEGDGMLVSNSGPPVRSQDRERIFDLGFSRKPGGQGTGLYVVRESLATIGYDISVGEIGDHWAFIIKPRQENP